MSVIEHTIRRKECADCGALITTSHANDCAGRSGTYRYVVREYVPADQLAGAVEALEEIKRDCGKVCANFELCDHVACQSSVAAWMIADKALTGLGGR